MNYNADFFLGFFSAIPEDKWHTGAYESPDERKFCALGHLFKAHSDLTDHGVYLHKSLVDIIGYPISNVNDGFHPKYQQKIIKKRILAALHDAKAAGK